MINALDLGSAMQALQRNLTATPNQVMLQFYTDNQAQLEKCRNSSGLVEPSCTEAAGIMNKDFSQILMAERNVSRKLDRATSMISFRIEIQDKNPEPQS